MAQTDKINILKEELEIQKEKLEKLKFYVFWLESQIGLEQIKMKIEDIKEVQMEQSK